MPKLMKKRRSRKRVKRVSTYAAERWFTSVVAINFDGGANISVIGSHEGYLGLNAEYSYFRNNFRKANILYSTCTFMPNLAVMNSTSQTAYTAPLCIAPYYGNFDATSLTYGRVGVIPGARYFNIGSEWNPSVKWYKKKDLEDFDTTSGTTGRTLDETYGGFLIFCDGTGYTSGYFAGTLVIKWKMGFSDPRYS